jgi:methionyl aminopeptidase
MTITYKDAHGIEGMRIAGRLTSEVLDYLTPFIKPGITTNAIDKLAHDYIVNVQEGIPAPLNYTGGGNKPYPKSVCTSINHQVCHGIPNDKPLKKGDIVNVDVTVIKDGWHGDSSRMFQVGDVSIAAKRLCSMTYNAMWHGIKIIWATLATPSSNLLKGMASAWCASFVATALARYSTKSRKCCITAALARSKSWSKA